MKSVEQLRLAVEAAQLEQDKSRKVLEEAQSQLEEALLEQNPFLKTLRTLPYLKTISRTIKVTGPFPNFKVQGCEYNLGMADLPLPALHGAKVCDLSEMMIPQVFYAEGSNILEKTQNFLSDKWELIKSYNAFVLPMDKMAKSKGQRPDLPNVTFAVTLLMLKNNVEFLVIDPLYKGTDATVRAINFSQVLRDLREKNKKVELNRNADGLKLIMYQRGSGSPNDTTLMQLERATGLKNSEIMRCHLTPGKYEQGEYGGNCYRDFRESVAKLIHELSIIKPYASRNGGGKEENLNTLFFVLDEFSAYAAYTATCIVGYQLCDVACVLAYRHGVYTQMPCAC